MQLENRMVMGDIEEQEPVCECCVCGEELYAGDEAFRIESDVYCEDCFKRAEKRDYGWIVE